MTRSFKLRSLAFLALAPLLMAQDAGCQNQPLPTVAQIELNLPAYMRTCPYAPKSPGKNATRKQTAEYIAKLYNAWEICHGNVADIDRLYKKYLAEVVNLKGRDK
jgi:hypothetical protein